MLSLKSRMTLVVASVASLGLADAASAGHRRSGEIWIEPVYEIVERRIVLPAEYKTRLREVYVEPVYEYVERRIWVPDPDPGLQFKFANDDFGFGFKIGGDDNRGHYEIVRERVCVQEGYTTTVAEKVLIRPERVKVVHERVCVQEGYWLKVSQQKGYKKHDKQGKHGKHKRHHDGRQRSRGTVKVVVR